MLLPIDFDKTRAEQIRLALVAGRPLDPLPGGLTVHGMLALAGVCFLAVWTHTPELYAAARQATPWPWDEVPAELLEAREASFLADLHLAVEYYAHLTMLVREGRYDDEAGPRARAVVLVDTDGRKRVIPGEGFRGGSDRVDDDRVRAIASSVLHVAGAIENAVSCSRALTPVHPKPRFQIGTVHGPSKMQSP